jgi:hypothetical protein
LPDGFHIELTRNVIHSLLMKTSMNFKKAAIATVAASALVFGGNVAAFAVESVSTPVVNGATSPIAAPAASDAYKAAMDAYRAALATYKTAMVEFKAARISYSDAMKAWQDTVKPLNDARKAIATQFNADIKAANAAYANGTTDFRIARDAAIAKLKSAEALLTPPPAKPTMPKPVKPTKPTKPVKPTPSPSPTN